MQMLFQNAKWILNGHFIAGKWHHLAAKLAMEGVQGRVF
jgi:hypothetical protein